jgi:YidC/Oxa1 family membrane protein insertase
VVALAGGSPDLHSLTALADAVRPLTSEAQAAAAGELGWWGSYIKLVEDGIFTLHDFLSSNNIPYPYGLSIFAFVLGVKLVTLPLNYQQLSSTSQMKAMKPQQDLVKKWYGDNKDMLNMQTGALFERYNVNPLAGCLPSLAQIPVFLGVYYSVTSIAKAKVFSEGFLWLPSLSGPIADRREGISWLTDNWTDGAPGLGWHDTLCYLSIPVILVITQTTALYLLGSFEALEADEGNQQTQSAGLVLRVLPFMLGWFAMNAPAGLGLYWVFNNILTTATTLTVKKITEKPPIEIDVNLATLGPRRDPVPLRETNEMEWGPGGRSSGQPAAEPDAQGAVVPAATAAVPAAAEK